MVKHLPLLGWVFFFFGKKVLKQNRGVISLQQSKTNCALPYGNQSHWTSVNSWGGQRHASVIKCTAYSE